jgi:hypothetical protein
MQITDYTVRSVLRAYSRKLQKGRTEPGTEQMEKVSFDQAEKVSFSEEGKRKLLFGQLKTTTKSYICSPG